MSVPGTRPRIPPIPPGIDTAITWFAGVSDGLVLLEEYPLDDLRRAVDEFGRRVRVHCEDGDGVDQRTPGGGETQRRLAADHVWYGTSVEQLRWFLRIVESDDHGGHRQALGQYGRILTESLRRHRVEELSLGARAEPGPRSAARNSN